MQFYNDPNFNPDYINSGDTKSGELLKTCFVRKMSAALTTSLMFTDGISTLQNGYLSNLNFPTQPSDVATKEYVASLPASTINQISGPYRSVQFNNGNVNSPGFAGSPNFTISTLGSLVVNNRINIAGTNPLFLPITIFNGEISNITDPVNITDVSNKNYITNITTSTLYTAVSSTNLVPANIYNNILKRIINVAPTNIQDILPSTSDIINYIGLSSISQTNSTTGHYTTFSFVYNYIGPYNQAVSLFAGTDNFIISKGDYLNLNTSLNVITVPVNTSVSFTAILAPNLNTSSTGPLYSTTFYINNLQTIYADNNEQIVPAGLTTKTFYSVNGSKYKTFSTFIIYPLVALNIQSNNSHTYIFSELKGLLAIRNMNNNVTDSFDLPTNILANPEFINVPNGSIKFTIQNISQYTLTLNLGSWQGSGTDPIIPTGKNGFFLIKFNVTNLSCTLFTIGIYSRSSL